MRFFTAVAVSMSFLSVPAWAVDTTSGLLAEGYPSGISKDACVWSRPHIVFENNSKWRVTFEYVIGQQSQGDAEILGTGRKTIVVEPGKGVKQEFQDLSSVFVVFTVAHGGKAESVKDPKRFDFHNCPSKTKGELSKDFPAWKYTYKKDGSREFTARKK